MQHTGLSRIARAAGRISLLLSALFLVAAMAVWVFQERFVFVPPPVPTVQGRGTTRLNYAASDGQRLFGFLVEPNASDRMHGAIVVFHGNGDLADSWTDWARTASKRTGLPVLLAEYRGYGGLPGRSTYTGVLSDARAAIDVMSKRYALRPDQVTLYGHSLGTGVATSLAAERGAQTLVLEAPMTSLVDEGRRSFGPPLAWVLPLISRSPFTPIEQVTRILAPVWVAVGGRDEVAPPEMGRAVFAAAARKGELLEVATANHGNIADRGGEAYWAWFSRALASSTTVRATPSTTRAIRP